MKNKNRKCYFSPCNWPHCGCPKRQPASVKVEQKGWERKFWSLLSPETADLLRAELGEVKK